MKIVDESCKDVYLNIHDSMLRWLPTLLHHTYSTESNSGIAKSTVPPSEDVKSETSTDSLSTGKTEQGLLQSENSSPKESVDASLTGTVPAVVDTVPTETSTTSPGVHKTTTDEPVEKTHTSHEKST